MIIAPSPSSPLKTAIKTRILNLSSEDLEFLEYYKGLRIKIWLKLEMNEND